jgi:hypothetical protein
VLDWRSAVTLGERKLHVTSCVVARNVLNVGSGLRLGSGEGESVRYGRFSHLGAVVADFLLCAPSTPAFGATAPAERREAVKS